jgi:hypothetical protein
LNPLPLNENERFEEEYPFSWFVSKDQLEIENLDYEITKHNFFWIGSILPTY